MTSRSFDISQIDNYIDSNGAEKLGGHSASYYLDYSNFTNTPTAGVTADSAEANALALAIALG